MSAVARAALPLPRFVQLEPVGPRGLAGAGKPAALMSFEAFRRVLDQFPAMTELHLQGTGEPMLHPRFFDMVRAAAARGIGVSASSTLAALSPRRAEECVASGLARLHVSLDAAEPAAYEFSRVGARLERVVRSLDWLLAARRRNGPRLPEVVLVAVAMRRNLEELPALLRFAHGRGIEAVSVQYLPSDDRLRVERCFGEARAVAAELGVALRLPDPRPRSRPPSLKGPARCDWPWRRAYVSYSGEAMPCCMVATPERMSFGNMAREGVEPVWNGGAYLEFRARLDSDDPPEICKGCAVYNGTF